MSQDKLSEVQQDITKTLKHLSALSKEIISNKDIPDEEKQTLRELTAIPQKL